MFVPGRRDKVGMQINKINGVINRNIKMCLSHFLTAELEIKRIA